MRVFQKVLLPYPLLRFQRKMDMQRNTKNLNYFDAVVFAGTTGELDLDDGQKQDILSFVKEDGAFTQRSTPITNGRSMAS